MKSRKVTRWALTAGILICWGFAIAIVVTIAWSHSSLELTLALSGIAATLVSTGFSQFGMLSQMKGERSDEQHITKTTS